MTNTPIVLVHGIRLSHTCWAEVIDRLAPRRPVLAIDLPGHGRRRGERFTLPGAIEAVAESIDRQGGNALVVGHSLGGFVSIATAAAHPGRVSGLVVAGSTLVPGRTLSMPFRLMHRALSSRPDGGKALSERVFDRAVPSRVAADIARGGIATEAIPDVLAALTGFDPLAALAAYPGPVRLVNGGHDHFRLGEQAFLRAAADARLLVVPRAGHYLPLTHADAFAGLVADFAASIEMAKSMVSNMAKLTITVPDADLAFFEAAAARNGLKVSPYFVRAAKIGALWEDANRPRQRDAADDVARAEELLALDEAADSDAHNGHGHAA
ncbi:alpha/beta fold hydrolase [Nocardia sp. ET3-3]|uniref:Alpha/beta fold hydrolase n=1 Tax=Nocardia terrae TaxID=2675851 RepID=A0A7K1V949_9NOCA|nr:alpha/beta hydrolase [Nocardia terrae]MVU82638.1 alpha/beta fold hydrolase [Nocardia terrae]